MLANSSKEAQKLRRVLKEVGPGQYQQMPEMQSMEGRVVAAPITDRRILTAADLPAAPSEFFIHQQSTMTPITQAQAAMSPTIGVAETAQGGTVAYRNEAPTGVNSSSVRRPLRFTIINAGAAAVNVPLGDGAGLVALKQNKAGTFPAVLPANVTVTGTYGAQSYAAFQRLTQSAILDLHGLHLAAYDDANSEDPTVFDEGDIILQSVSPDFQNINEIVLPLSDLLGSGDFRPNIREDSSFRFKAGPLTAINVLIPAGTKLVMTFRKISSIGLPGHFFKTELFK